MAIAQELIDILVCPETKQALKLADEQIVDLFNEKTRSGKLNNLGENPVDQEVSALLIREDGEVVYPIRDDIPVLLVDEGVRTSTFR